jgi:hypothetical protein
MMSPDAWQTIGTILALLGVGAYNVLRTHRAERAAKAAAERAQTAVIQTEATGNGFARNVLDHLDSIEAKVDGVADANAATHQLIVEHLSAHAHHDLSPRPRT